uniref:Signal peptidase n=1 Tax=Clostridium perfringens TaxID=1502 RepID=K9MEC0_CLOPF|nr:Signal peptidase [Clostridium perfringens]
MSPTLKVGNQLFVTKVYNTSNIKKGDILVFNSQEKIRLIFFINLIFSAEYKTPINITYNN